MCLEPGRLCKVSSSARKSFDSLPLKTRSGQAFRRSSALQFPPIIIVPWSRCQKRASNAPPGVVSVPERAGCTASRNCAAERVKMLLPVTVVTLSARIFAERVECFQR